MRGKTITMGMTIALAVALVLGVLAPLGLSSNDTGNSPGPRAVFQIYDVNDLQDMQSHLDDDCILMNDIDATITSTWNGGEGFNPIGDGIIAFTDSLDGQNHTIIGLYINRTVDYVGLFGYMGTGSSAKDFSLSGIEINGFDYAGSFTGYNDGGSIMNCYSIGNVSGGDWFVGSFLGYNDGSIADCYCRGNASGDRDVGGFAGINAGTITNCHSTGNASGTDYVGGFAGYNNGVGTITNCSSTGNATGGDSVGGFAGDNSVGGSIANCYSTGSASGTDYVGGFAGWNFLGIITNCYCTGTANGTEGVVGGFAGFNCGTIRYCYSIGNATGTGDDVGGFAGNNTGAGTITDCFWDTETSGQTTSDGGTGKTTTDMMQQATFTNWDFTTIWGIFNGYTYPYFQLYDQNLQLSVELPLSEGWNLISLSLVQINESITEVLSSINGKWDCIRTYDPLSPEPWKSNATFRPSQLNDFSTLNHKQGFWINITESNVNLTVSGPIKTSTSINLYAGWNLVGYPSLTYETVANALWGTGADKVMVCDTSEPYHIKEVGPTYVMKPGEGYWVHVPADTVWVIDL
jgi:hypothetical protein